MFRSTALSGKIRVIRLILFSYLLNGFCLRDLCEIRGESGPV